MSKIIFHNGNIYPTTKEKERFDFLVTQNGLVNGFGKRSEIPPITDEYVEVDLKGKTLLPGFHDPHVHIWKVGHLKTSMLDVRGVGSIEEMKEMMHAFGKDMPKDKWFLARGYNEAIMKESRHPTREDLDAVFPDRPVLLIRACAHIGIANSKAIELAGITEKTPLPPGAVAHKDSSGKLNGQFEESAVGFFWNVIPAPTMHEYQEMILAAHHELLSMGVTSAIDPEVMPALLEAYRDLNSRDELLIPTGIMAVRRPDGGSKTLPLPEKVDTENLQVNMIKLFSDGGLSGATAALSKKYKGMNSYGVLRLTAEDIYGLMLEAAQNGFQMGIHAIGDAAIEETISGYEKLRKEIELLRPRIEHFALPSEAHIERLHAMNGVNAPQPMFLPEFGDNYYRYCEEDLLKRTYPFKTLLEAGIPTAFSSDGPVVIDLSPLAGIQASMERKTRSGRAIVPEEAISLEQALECYTKHAVYSNFREDVSGSLEVGKRADMVVLEDNIFETSVQKISQLKVDSTWVKGECHFQS